MIDLNIEKLSYYLGGVGLLLLLGVGWYLIKGKKDMEEELKKKLAEEEGAQIGEGGDGLYTLCPTGDGAVPNILINDPDGNVEVDKINSIIPREIYKNYPKTEEERIDRRRDFVINMIVAEGGAEDFR